VRSIYWTGVQVIPFSPFCSEIFRHFFIVPVKKKDFAAKAHIENKKPSSLKELKQATIRSVLF